MWIVLRNDFALYAYFVTTLMKLKEGACIHIFSRNKASHEELFKYLHDNSKSAQLAR